MGSGGASVLVLLGFYFLLLYATPAYSNLNSTTAAPNIKPLYLGNPIRNLWGTDEYEQLFRLLISDESDTAILSLTLSGGTGDADMRIKKDGLPSRASSDWSSTETSSYEMVNIFARRGVYYILLYGFTAFSGVILEAVNVTLAPLNFGDSVTNLAAGLREKMFFSLSVPSGSFMQYHAIHTSGGSGNVDLFVRKSDLPTTSTYGWSSRRTDNNEEVTFPVTHNRVYYILLYGARAFSGVILEAVNVTVAPLNIGVSVTNLAAGSRETMFFKLSVPSGSFMQYHAIRTSGGSGNADLFVRKSDLPTTSTYGWSSRRTDNYEEVTFPATHNNFYYILLYGTSAFSGVTLEVVNVTMTSLTLGVPVTDLTGRSREKMFFKLSPPSGSFVQLLAIRAVGGSGNVDLFVRNSYIPTTSSYSWSSTRADNDEEIFFPVSYYSFYYILLYGTSAFSGVTLEVVNVTMSSLTLGVPVTNLTGRSREKMFFKLSVPSGSFVQLLAIRAFGGSGNVDLFVETYDIPTTSSYSRSSTRADNDEEISLYHFSYLYVLLYGTSAFANVTLKATNVTISHLSIDSSLNNLAAGAGEKLFYKVIVAQGSYIQALNISLSGGYGNADIYMKRNYPATISSYNWKSRRENNEDNVVCSGLSSGLYYILIYGSSAITNKTLRVENTTILATILELDVPASNLTIHASGIHMFKLILPHFPHAKRVIIRVSGEVSMYVRKGELPGSLRYHYNSQSIAIYGPPQGVYYVLLTAEVIQYGVYLVTTKSTLGPTVLLQNAVPITNLQGDNSIRLYYKFVLHPESPARFMKITLFGGHGDADLCVTKGTWPNKQIYDKRSVGGKKDAVFIQSPAAGIYYILVYAFTNFHNYTLTVTVWPPPIPRPTTSGVISSTYLMSDQTTPPEMTTIASHQPSSTLTAATTSTPIISSSTPVIQISTTPVYTETQQDQKTIAFSPSFATSIFSSVIQTSAPVLTTTTNKVMGVTSSFTTTPTTIMPSRTSWPASTSMPTSTSWPVPTSMPPLSTMTPPSDVMMLHNETRVIVNGSKHSTSHYNIRVPRKTLITSYTLKAKLSGGVGDPGLFVRESHKATVTTYDKKSSKIGTDEKITIDDIDRENGTEYFILVYGYKAFFGVTLQVTILSETIHQLQNNSVWTIPDSSKREKHTTFFNVSSAIAGNLVVQTFGGNGDPDVYVKFQSRPTLSIHDGKSDKSGSDEMININHLQTGYYFILIYAYAGFAGVSLKVYVSNNAHSGPTFLIWGVPISNISMSTGTEKHFTVDNTAFAEVHVQTKARDGDADLYVRKGSKASRSDFDKRSIGISSNETVVFTAASTGIYHILVYAYSAVTNLTIQARGPPGPITLTTSVTTISPTTAAPASSQLALNVTRRLQTLALHHSRRYSITIGSLPVLYIVISAPGGDADLYVKKETPPTLIIYDKKSAGSNSNESVQFTSPTAGIYHILVYAYSAVANLTIQARGPPGPITLTRGVALTGIGGGLGSKTFYKFVVRRNDISTTRTLLFETFGGSGDPDLYVKHGSKPTTDDFHHKSIKPGPTERVTVSSFQTGDYFIMLHGYSRFSGVSLMAKFLTTIVTTISPTTAAPSSSQLTLNVASRLETLSFRHSSRYSITISSLPSLHIDITASGGDADLYVKKETPPTRIIYDKKSVRSTSNESVQFTSPSAGTFHILVYAYSAVTNLSVEARGPPRNITVGLPLTGLSGATGSKSYYILVITEALKNLVGAGSLAIETFGGIGDPNLYVKHNSKPTQTDYDVHSANSGSTDKVTITSVQTGSYYILLYAYATFSGVTLKATISVQQIQNGTGILFSGTKGINLHFKILVPEGIDVLKFTLSGGYGDPDLYVMKGQRATRTAYNQSSVNGGSEEIIRISNPEHSEYYVLVFGYTAFGGVTLWASMIGNTTTELQNGIAWNSPSTARNGKRFARITVPSSNNGILVVTTYGGNGDPDLYVKHNAKPTLSSNEAKSTAVGVSERVVITPYQQGVYFIMVYAYDSFTGVSVKAEYTVPTTVAPSASTTLASSAALAAGAAAAENTRLAINVPRVGIAMATGQALYFTVVVTSLPELTIVTSANSGDVDLYVKREGKASRSSFDKKSLGRGSDESVYFLAPNNGIFSILVYAHSGISNLSIVARGPPQVTTLNSGQVLTGLSGTRGNRQFYKIHVPRGQELLNISSGDGSGDCDLYVKFGRRPRTGGSPYSEGGSGTSNSTYDYKSASATTDESVTIPFPLEGDFYILMETRSDYHRMFLVATYKRWPRLVNGQSTTIRQLAVGKTLVYAFEVSGGSNLAFVLSGGSGDMDLYVKFGSVPSESQSDYSSMRSNNDESITIQSPKIGTYYALLKATDDNVKNVKFVVTIQNLGNE